MKTGSSQRYFQSAGVSFYVHKLNTRDFSPIYWAFGGKSFRFFLFFFSFILIFFSDDQSLKIENENNNIKT